jgi:hypothetical protein
MKLHAAAAASAAEARFFEPPALRGPAAAAPAPSAASAAAAAPEPEPEPEPYTGPYVVPEGLRPPPPLTFNWIGPPDQEASPAAAAAGPPA